MIWLQLLPIALLITLTCSHGSYATFQIRKKHTSNDQSQTVATMKVQFPLFNSNQVEFKRNYFGDFITPEDFNNNHQAILEFLCVETDLPEYKDRTFMTSIDEISSQPHGEKIVIILGPQPDNFVINSINYVQVNIYQSKTRERVGDFFTQIVQTKAKQDQIFRYQYAPKKSQVENQSFFAKYVNML